MKKQSWFFGILGVLTAMSLSPADAGTFTDIGPAGATSVNPVGISGNNIVGAYQDSNYNSYFFLFNGSTYSDLPSPPGSISNYTGIDGNNII